MPKKNTIINRRQFIVKSVVGVCGLGALYGTFKFGLSSQEGYPESLQSINYGKIEISPYSQDVLFFDQHQYAVVATIAGLIIPSDDEPGAKEAYVANYIDRITYGHQKKEQIYAKGIDWLDKYCEAKYGQKFLDLNQLEQVEIVNDALGDRPSNSFLPRVERKIRKIYDGVNSIGFNRSFFHEIYEDVIDGFYSNPISWQAIGYFGPPNPVGYPDFSEKPSAAQYLGSTRLVDDASCITCHEIGEHPRGGLIDHSCTVCHRPHQPWPYDKSSFYLEDHVGVIFSSPDRKNGDL